MLSGRSKSVEAKGIRKGHQDAIATTVGSIRSTAHAFTLILSYMRAGMKYNYQKCRIDLQPADEVRKEAENSGNQFCFPVRSFPYGVPWAHNEPKTSPDSGLPFRCQRCSDFGLNA